MAHGKIFALVGSGGKSGKAAVVVGQVLFNGSAEIEEAVVTTDENPPVLAQLVQGCLHLCRVFHWLPLFSESKRRLIDHFILPFGNVWCGAAARVKEEDGQ